MPQSVCSPLKQTRLPTFSCLDWSGVIACPLRNGLATLQVRAVCNLYSITTNQAAIIALFRVINRYVGNLPPMPGVFPDYPAPVVRNVGNDR